ncbi:FAD-binding oxidoreductase [Aspergillus mulundensis]|uniref:FAD-binding PCMH-type domain-containing protein n=1 Tax=Aspergillus mulundensis TaxID=1810919 RepID=A0A3D8S5Q5_9EURO|nr:Uncharacterized protein DSM5745_04901 [Aspergillus mulundensis]RDW81344.1 Uncharacterized protein DSM5745_04901 [Aspergillus mulundensis]
MPPLSISALLDSLSLTFAQRSQLEFILSDFISLTSDGKEPARHSILAQVFTLVFGDNAITKGSPLYEEHRTQPWSPTCYLAPTVILTPTTVPQVQQALALIRFLNAKFSIRGGGHLQNPGFSSNDGGIVIYFCKGEFTQLVLSPDKETVEIGVGLRWADVYERLDGYGLAVAGGREPRVGVAGLLLSGGLSYQCGEVGVGCMGVVEYEVVLADSTVVRASKHENADLFWALKAGGSNFGIITKVIMTTLPNTLWSENRLYDASQNTAFASALLIYHDLIESDNKSCLIYHTVNDRTFVTFTYSGPVEGDHPEIFRPFHHIPHTGYLVPPGTRTVSAMAKGVSDVLEGSKMLHEMRTTTTLPDLEVYHAAEQARLEAITALSHLDRAGLTMVIQPMTSHSVNAAQDRGGNPFGLPAVKHQIFLILADYTNPTDAPLIQDAMRKIVNAVGGVAKKNGTYLPFKYANYAAPDQDPLGSYGAANLASLRIIAGKYDPGGVFQYLQNGGWLVSMAGLKGEVKE